MTNCEFNRIIHESIGYCINEELSVADAVTKYVNDIVSQIEESNKKNRFVFFDKHVIIDKASSVTCEYREKVFWGKSRIYDTIELPCKVVVLDFDDVTTATEEVIKSELWGINNFDQYSLDITVTINGVNGKLNMVLLRHLVYHEAEHAYQYFRKFGKLFNSDSKYAKAMQIVKGSDRYHTSDAFRLIASLMYYYNAREVDANVNALYGELSHNQVNSIEGTNFYQEYRTHEEELERFIENFSEMNLIKELTYFGVTLNIFIKWLVNQRKYMARKISHVVKKAKKEGNIIEMRLSKPPIGL